MWLDDLEAHFTGHTDDRHPLPAIVGVRTMEHEDLMFLEKLVCPSTCSVFGDVHLGRIYEASCLSVVQWNEKHDLVSGMCLCNYPNVPAVTPEDWPSWLQTLYRVENMTERNSLFVHFLAWDHRYTGRFFEELMTGVFDAASHLLHVILVQPPRTILEDVFENQMTRIRPTCFSMSCGAQKLLVAFRHAVIPRQKIRRVVEEDNDTVIPLIDQESTLLKELYGEYYVSEMVRYPTDFRQLIVSEDQGGLATGVMFLSNRMDVDMLNENFELALYNGLRKPHKHDVIPDESFEPASKTFCSVFTEQPVETLDEFPIMTSSDKSTEVLEEVAEGSSSSLCAYDVNTAKTSESATTDDDDQSFNLWSILMHGIVDSTDDIPRNKGKDVWIKPTHEKTEDIEIQLPPQPIYRGQPNAFVVEVFAFDDHVKRGCNTIFFEAAFECFPDRNYCTILIPTAHPELAFLRNFVRVPVRCNRDFPMALYVTHRAAILGDISTRRAGPQDRDAVRILLQKIPKGETILEDFDEAVRTKRSDLFCYLFVWNDKVVGVTIFCLEKDVTYIRRRFHVEDYISTKHVAQDAYGCIIHFVLMPIFGIHLRHFFYEISRQSGLIVFYYRLTEKMMSALTRSQPLPICLNSMVHVQPRRRIEYRFRGLVETDQPKIESEPFSVFMTTPRMISDTSLVHDTKIVVIGASECGVALLEHLAFGAPHESTRYANVTLISPHGLPFENERSSAVTSMIPFHGRYCPEHRRLVAARSWINVVYGTVVEINRKEKHVTVMNRGEIAYDYLVVTCGLQYQKPQFQEELDMIKRGEWTEQEQPWNCSTINDDTQAATCLEKIRLLTNNFVDEKRIVLYGHNIDCYCTLQGLLESGINGSWITLIEPPIRPCDSHESVFFNDCEVHAMVMTHILESGVKLLQEWELIDWYLQDSRKEGMIEALVLRSKDSIKIVQCDALIAFHEKTIDPKIFLAFCKAGLMYDGLLVIDSEFRTNDPFVFAAGNSTKYSRKLYAAFWQHRYFNGVEIGERLAKVLRSIIVKQQRYGEKAVKRCKHKKKYFPFSSFRAPIIVACTLPGGCRFLHVHQPGKIPRNKNSFPVDAGKEMVTGSCDSEIGYFRLRLNHYDTVETITCFSRKDFEVHQMIRLYGKHESLLNQLKTRFQDSLISDFFAYFREPWATALFIDRFDCLRMENRATLLSKTVVPGQSLIEDCIRAFQKSNWKEMEDTDHRRIVAKYAGSVYHQQLEEKLLQFLQFCEEDAPVYCTPGKLRELYADLEESTLYTTLCSRPCHAFSSNENAK